MTTQRTAAIHRSSSPYAEQWQAQTLHDDAALTRLAGEWDDLYLRCRAATPFMSHAWLDAWWRSYGRPGRLVVVVVRRAGRLVAAAALMRRRFAVLTPVGAGISDYSDVLIDDSCAEEATRHLVRELAAQARWRVIDLPDVPPPAAVWRVVDAWSFRSWRLLGMTCLEVPAQPMEHLLQTLPSRSAKKSRQKRRKIEATHIDARVTDRREAADAVAAMLRLHRQQWRGRGMNREHGRSRFAAHLSRAVPMMVERGQALAVEYRMNNELAAVDLLVVDRAAVRAYLYGTRPDLRRHVDVNHLLFEKNLDIAQRLGLSTLSLLRGDEQHKRHWRPREARNQRVLVAGPGHLPAQLYATGLRARYRLARTIKTRLPALAQALRRIKAAVPLSA